MPDPNLAEISHLFLSSIRDRGGAVRPQRTPPPSAPPASMKNNVSVDLTPEEFAQVRDDGAPPAESATVVPPITAVLASHFAIEQSQRVRQYARHLAAVGGRIGLIEIDACEFRITCFDGSPGAAAGAPLNPSDNFDAREMAQALEELSWDMKRWLVVVTNPRLHEARSLLKQIDRWVMLSGCDHEGVVLCYRMLKGLADVHRPELSLAVLDAKDEAQAAKVVEKLSGVCQQFLSWSLNAQPTVQPASQVVEHSVMYCSATRDKSRVATAPQWQVVSDLIARATRTPSESPAAEIAPSAESNIEATEPTPMLNAPINDRINDIIDVPADGSETEILAAIIRHGGNELIECPIAPPMCPSAKLAVNRQRQIVMLAIARDGLVDLRLIGQAYRWLTENRALVCMALPQLAIDPHPLPELRLFINQSDATAEAITPLLGSAHITVRAYRKLRWGEKTGVLLEAA
jgi:hypothetical protein